MHDLDRTDGRTHTEGESMFESMFERDNESFEFEAEQTGVLSEAEVNELAAELLSVANQRELNEFLGDLMKKAAQGVGKALSSPLGQQLGGMLKSAAKTALPVAGSTIGNALLPGIGGAIGGKLASAAGSMFGLETEGMTQEDRQYEVAKQFVRFGADATEKALELAKDGNPAPAAAKAAVVQAAERFVPGLVAPSPASSAVVPPTAQRGSWVRHGNKIIIHLGRE